MANHAFVIPKKGKRLPSNKRLHEFICDIVEKHLPGFVVEFSEGGEGLWADKGDYQWHIHHKTWDIDYTGVLCWVSRYPYPSGPCRMGRKVVEFRHTTAGSPFDWWLELEVRIRIAHFVDGVIEDEGIMGETWPPEKEHTVGKTFYEYLKNKARRDSRLRKKDRKAWQEWLLMYYLEFIWAAQHGTKPFPQEMIDWFGIPKGELERAWKYMKEWHVQQKKWEKKYAN